MTRRSQRFVMGVLVMVTWVCAFEVGRLVRIARAAEHDADRALSIAEKCADTLEVAYNAVDWAGREPVCE